MDYINGYFHKLLIKKKKKKKKKKIWFILHIVYAKKR